MWSAKCPKCGAKILLEDANAKVVQCASCGAQVSVNINVNYNYSKSEHTEHIVDDAKIKQAQNVDRVINLFASPIEERRAKKKAEEERIQREAEEAERIRKEQEAKDAEEQRVYEEWASAQHEKQARQAGRAIAKAINYYRANERKILISVVLIVALLACRGVYDSINQKREQELAAHQAELARLKDEEIAGIAPCYGRSPHAKHFHERRCPRCHEKAARCRFHQYRRSAKAGSRSWQKSRSVRHHRDHCRRRTFL